MPASGKAASVIIAAGSCFISDVYCIVYSPKMLREDVSMEQNIARFFLAIFATKTVVKYD